MRHILVLWGAVLGLMVTGCGVAQGETKEVVVIETVTEKVVEKEIVMAEPTKAPEPSSTERLIIRNANLQLVVRDTEAALDQINALVNDLDGYVVSSQLTKYEQGTRINLTVRVPADSLDTILAQLRDIALEVRYQNVTGQDVTEEYTDLQARLRHLEATETRLLTLLEGAEDTEATLAVYSELWQVQGQVEQIKGRIQYLEQSSALSTVSIELIPDELAQPISVAGWRPQGTLRQALESLIRTLQFLADALIWIVAYVLPVVLLFLGLPIIMLVRLIRRRR